MELEPPKLTDRVGELPPPNLSDRVDALKPKAFNVGTQAVPRIIPAIDTSIEIQDPVETASIAAAPARKAVKQARMFGVTPVMASGAAADLEAHDQQQRVGTLSGLPSLRQYAEQSAHHAASISDDVDNLGVVDWAFGQKLSRPVPPEAKGPWAEYQREHGGTEPIAYPGWLLSYGRFVYNFVTNLKIFKEIKFDGAVNMEDLKKRQQIAATPIPGEDRPVGKLLFGGQDLVQSVLPYMMGPGIAFGAMYVEGTAQTYQALRKHGYQHQEAADVSEVAGFSSAVVGSLLGQRLFGSLIPKMTVQTAMDAVPGALQRAFYDNPMLWKTIRDIGLNQLHAGALNVGMALTNAAVVEVYDAHSRKHPLHLSVFTDTLNRAAMDSLKLLPLSIYAGMRQSKARGETYKAGEAFRAEQKDIAASMDVEQRIFDEHEKQGHALRSLKEAADVDAAVQAIQKSKFFKESPEEGKRLVQSMLHPRKTQSVFIDPEYFHSLPEDAQASMNPMNADEASMSGSPVEVPLADFVTHPDAPSLTKHTAAGPDLLTPAEAYSRANPPDLQDLAGQELSKLLAERTQAMQEPDGPEKRAHLQEIELRMRAAANSAPLRPRDTRGMGVGEPADVISIGPRQVKRQIDRLDLNNLPEPATGLDKNDPILKDEEVQALIAQTDPTQPANRENKIRPVPPMLGFRGKLSKERLSAWAEAEVEGRKIGSFETLQDLHRQNASAAEKRATTLQEQATGALGRSTRKAQKGVSAGVESGEVAQVGAKGALSEEMSRGAVENLIDRSQKWVKKAEDKGVGAVKEEVKAGDKIAQVEKLQKIQKVNEAMRDAVKKARQEAGGIQQVISDQNKPEARREAYAAGWEFGAAKDAVLEALGGKQTGWGAPDVSDLYQKLRELGYSGEIDFDVKFVNRLLGEPKALKAMTLPEAREVQRFLKNIDDLSWAINRVRSDAKMQNTEALRGKVIDYLKNVEFKPAGQRAWVDSKSALTLRQRFGAGKAALASDLNQPYTIFAKMGPVGDKLWFDGFVPARNREERLHDMVMPDFEAIDRALPDEIRNTAKDIVPSLPGSPGKWGLRTRDEVWRLTLHLGTPEGIKEISKNLGVQPALLMQWVQQNIAKTPEQRQAVMEGLIQPTWKIFNKLWNEYEPALKERGLPPPKKLSAEPFMLDGKTYSGGYGGRLRWTGEGWDHSVDPNSVAALFGLDYYGPSTPQAHLMERTGAPQGSFPDLQWSGVASSLKSEAHDLAFHGFVENVHRLLSPGAFRDTLSDKIGRQFVNQLYDPANKTSWLHVLAQGRIPDLHTLSATGIISNLQGRAAISAFALNLRVVAMQLSHIPAMAAGMDLNPLWSIRAFNGNRRAWAEASSQILNYRQNDFERHNTELLGHLTGVRPGEGFLAEKIPGAAALQNGLNKFNWEIWREVDGRLSHAIWEMGLEKGLRRGMSQEDAMREADRAVQRGMPVQTIYEQSAFVRDRKMVGLMFLVRNFPNTLYNVSALNAWDAKVQGKSALGGVLGSGARYLGMVLAAEVIGKGLFGGHLPKSDESSDEWVVSNAVRSVFYPMYLDAPAEYVVKKAYGDDHAAKKALEHLTPPAISTFTRALENLGKAVGDDDEAGIRAAMEVLGVATKLPIPRLYDWTRALFESDTPAEVVGRGAGYMRGDQ